LIPEYAEYLRVQQEEFRSHESEVERWAEGQRRFVEYAFRGKPLDLRLLDCACGDGVGLEALRALGFRDPIGVELSAGKARRARDRGFRVEELDMHDLTKFEAGSFGAILSSHTLEHAYDPVAVLAEFHRLLQAGGTLEVVLPYPDPGARNERAHTAKYELGTDRDDGGDFTTRFFLERGFELVARRQDSFREAELWLSLQRASV
jgi:SAM-dependent methyltransferase